MVFKSFPCESSLCGLSHIHARGAKPQKSVEILLLEKGCHTVFYIIYINLQL